MGSSVPFLPVVALIVWATLNTRHIPCEAVALLASRLWLLLGGSGAQAVIARAFRGVELFLDEGRAKVFVPPGTWRC